jgi:hypothetical protein
MKKKIIALLAAVLFLSLASIYVFIPNPLQISKITIINCTKNGIYRYLADENKWQLWWPVDNAQSKENINNKKDSFTCNADRYRLAQKLLNGVEISIQRNNSLYKSLFTLLSKGTDSVIVKWDCSINASWNPISRFLRYEQAVNIKKDMDAIVENLRLFSEKKESIYTIDITRSSITDTILIAAKYITSSYPDTKEVYDFIAPLKGYAKKFGAAQNGNPMLNITKLNAHEFQAMVAIPINKELPPNGNIFPQKMIPGNFITTQIKGGEYTINQALEQIHYYFEDYKKTSMAIPFQSLITDRSKEPDTAKWITKIYAPVMQ